VVLVDGQGATPTGQVTVSDSSGDTCNAGMSTGIGICTLEDSPASGTYTITVTYSGDDNYTEAQQVLTDAIGSSDSQSGTATATVDQTTVTGTGEGNVSVLQYDTDPVGPPSFTSAGVFFDVAASNGNTFSSQVIEDCNLNGGNQLLWWDPAADGGSGAWEPVVGDPGPIYSSGPPACLTATLDATSSPTIAQLTGTVFGVGTGGPQAPKFTSSYTVAEPAKAAFHYTVNTSGFPDPTIHEEGKLPTRVTFKDNGNGTATLSGTTTKLATYSLTFTATNASGTASQTFFLVIGQTPSITSKATAKFTEHKAGHVTITTKGTPSAQLTESGTLPPGMTFTDKGNGTATLSGTPTATGTYDLRITATNPVGSVTKTLMVTVGQVKKK
jgi:hypothetical protein